MLEMRQVTKTYSGSKRGMVHTALDQVSLSLIANQCLGVVGESGSGKTTLARCLIGLEKIDEGQIYFDGYDVTKLSAADWRALRAEIQIVFQDPYASLNPRMTAFEIICEPLKIHHARLNLNRAQKRDRVMDLLNLVGLGERHVNRYPHEFSGGQRQRIGIARALAVNPKLLILDEPTSALDVSVQAQILNLLLDLQKTLKLSYLFISHDLGVVRYMADQTLLLLHGRVIESGPIDQVFDHPQSDYARRLLAAIPDVDPAFSLHR
jgi:ABC-type oligopeptide transport system ATPase subunit